MNPITTITEEAAALITEGETGSVALFFDMCGWEPVPGIWELCPVWTTGADGDDDEA